MISWVLHSPGNIKKENTPVPIPENDNFLVEVKACGICGSDLPRIYETGAHVMPLTPGHEFAGKVHSLGGDADPKWLNKRVGVFPLIPCGECPQCREKRFEMCRNYGYIGSRQDGAFAEYVLVPEDNLIELPDAVSFEAAAMLEPMAVAVHAIRRTGLSLAEDGVKTPATEPSEQPWIAVCGLGTIGMLVAMFLWDAGYRRLILIGNKKAQRKMASVVGMGEAVYVASTGPATGSNEAAGSNAVTARINEITAGHGTDYYFECVGSAESASLGLRIAAPGGRVVFVGNPHGEMRFSREDYWKILRHQLRVTGTWNSSFTHEADDDWHYVLDRLQKGVIQPERLITHRFSLSDLPKGLELMRDKKEPYGKVMTVMKQE